MLKRLYRLTAALLCGVAIVASCVALSVQPAKATCNTTGTNQNCTNPAGTAVSGGAVGIDDNATITLNNAGTVTGSVIGVNASTDANVTNSGTIFGGNTGILAGRDANVSNSGTIVGGSYGVFGFRDVTLTNSGTISGDGYGVFASRNAVVNNSGTISSAASGVAGIYGANSVNVTNSGTISGAIGVFGGGGSPSVLTNSGTIIGLNGTAIDFLNSSSDTLNFLPGTRIRGDILLGQNDTVNIYTGGRGFALRFGACGCGGGITDTNSVVNVFGGALYVINGNTIAVLDPTAFGMSDRAMMDFTGNISSLLGSRFDEFAAGGTAGATAFAASPTSSLADAANAAFGGIPAIANSYAADTRMPNTTFVDRASGIAVWSKGFVGARRQDADGPNLAATTLTFGGLLGIDKNVSPDLRLGAFIGAGYGKLKVDLDSQTVKTDYVYAGVYGRYDWSAQFINYALSAGRTSNSSDRSVASNTGPDGFETATARYNGWFISPELAYGIRMPMGGTIVVTPTVRLRYLASFTNGYTETGSAQNLTVASHTTQNLEERFELAISRTDPVRSGVLKTTATFGVLGQERLGGTTFNTVLIGQNLSFATPGKNNVAGAFIGLGFDYRVTQMTSLFAAIEGTAMSDKSQTGIAQGGVRIAF